MSPPADPSPRRLVQCGVLGLLCGLFGCHGDHAPVPAELAVPLATPSGEAPAPAPAASSAATPNAGAAITDASTADVPTADVPTADAPTADAPTAPPASLSSTTVARADPAGSAPPAPAEDMCAKLQQRIEGRGAAGECASDADCARTGCSGEVCVTVANAAEVMTTCELHPCFSTLSSCGCDAGQCLWTRKQAAPLPLKLDTSASGVQAP